jgi:hypothetical protein
MMAAVTSVTPSACMQGVSLDVKMQNTDNTGEQLGFRASLDQLWISTGGSIQVRMHASIATGLSPLPPTHPPIKAYVWPAAAEPHAP